ncbi:carbohydrate ABC transporter permease [Paenibacillus spongiae]|uniref:Sugar ABC transporter permease n=1 Tax=Paenibacillus spongiae TaxID=2909671 RepID=A0ABY5SES3_9BACL|nr:sugar ABC transporter permease [Paenibacillus spongiae]UVI31985.1 sugar ABC transporter permease [Paenibacillus spongiae]
MNRKLTIRQKKSLSGVLFIMPWLLGFLFLFAVPLFQSLQFSFSQLKVNPLGYTMEFVGFHNYKEALWVNADFNRILTDSVIGMIVNVPLILFFSLFSATLVNQKYWGRGLVRAIFFLPVILASGAVAAAEAGSLMNQLMISVTSGGASDIGASTGQLMSSRELGDFLVESGISPTFVNYLLNAVDQIYQIISNSGVQILIFLAGLQSISGSLYEVAKIEGATGYQMFWKITFPLVSPLILTNVIYTIIDSFSDNQMTRIIYESAFKSLNFGLSSAMVWMYSIVVGIILAIIGYLVSRKVFYND